MTAATILIPAKFIVLMGQLLITIVILHTKVPFFQNFSHHISSE